ncbi:MAG: hypothetical protein IPH79_14570 [Sphingomonadales bacterium]|nr:hypothetical protein [Sphingomonadales bacterium]
MNVPTKAQSIGRPTNSGECDDDMILCTWEDPDGVGHVLVGNKIAIKSISAKRAGGTSLTALNIGLTKPEKVRVSLLVAGHSTVAAGSNCCSIRTTNCSTRGSTLIR